MDVKEQRATDSRKRLRGLAFINDKDRAVKNELLEAIYSKSAEVICWSERNTPKAIELLKAS